VLGFTLDKTTKFGCLPAYMAHQVADIFLEGQLRPMPINKPISSPAQ
jgi:hypothetical protein